MRQRGKISNWNDARGFGFVFPEDGGERVFLHIKAFEKKHRRPIGEESVTYEVRHDERNRPQAANVRYAGVSAIPSGTWPAALIAVSFIAFIAMMAFLHRAPAWAVFVYAGVSLVTFFDYRADKRKAERKQWRTPEATLHLLELLGGWPGALVAQQVLRHKSRKTSFQIVFWSIVMAHLALWTWLALQNPAKRPQAPAVHGPASRGRAGERHR